MCIIFAYNGYQDENSDYSLIVASNRDEYYGRPSKNMWYWEEDHDVIGGRDLQADCDGGTWLAISPSRRKLGVLLNLPRSPKPNARSRGKIVADFVKSELSTNDYIQSLKNYGNECNDFVFVAIEFRNLVPVISTYSNTTDKLTSHIEKTLGFSNSLPEVPLKKVEAGIIQMNEICTRLPKLENKEELIKNLIQLLKDDARHLPDPELEKRRPGIQEHLSSIYVSVPEGGYGTRTHTLIAITKKGQVHVIETSLQPPMDLENPHWNKTEIQFDL